MDATARPSVFISYSHQDEVWKDRLVKQLRVLELEGDLEVWEDCRIEAGDDWLPEIEAAMARARAAVLLISADFLTSGFIRGKEVPELLKRCQTDGLRMIPVIVHPCAWTAVPWLSSIQCRPKDGKELVSFSRPKAEKHLASLALEIRGLLAGPLPTSSTNSELEEAPSPALHNLPYPRLGDLFTGRQEELDALAGGGTAAITQSAAISGLGGIGKTRLAVEYAWRSGNRYTAAWFVRSDSPENLRRNLAALAGPELLNLPEWEEQKEEETIAAVKRWLREHVGWLMILDNVDTPEAAEAILEVLPSLYKGRVLITSRLATWPASVRRQALGTLSIEEAVQFLLQRTEDGRTKEGDDDDRQAAALAEVLDGLPLALEQAAAFILRRRLRFSEYLQAWEQERAEVLKWHDPLAMEYPASVAVTWQHTFQQLTPTAAALLRLTAFLAPDPIPVEIFIKSAEHVTAAADLFCEESGKVPDGKPIREAVADLAGFSMVSQQDGRVLSVHRMVQEALRQQIPRDRRKNWIKGALWVVNDAAEGDPQDVRTWPLLDQWTPHAAQVVTWADQERITESTSQVMNQLGLLFLEKGLFAQAESWLRRALDIDEVAFGSEHPNVAAHLNNLAQVLHDTDRLEEAEPLMRRALAIDEAAFGNNHPSVASDLGNMAALLLDTNRLEEAEPLMRRALAIDEAAFGKEHPAVAIDLNSLSRLLQDTNRLVEAELLARRALAIDEAAFGNDHPNFAIDLSYLALLLQVMNRLEEAEPLMRRAVDIFERSLGSDHPRTQLARKNLAVLLAKLNEVAGDPGSPTP